MARIRSIHPGLFTDEAFVSVSMAARVLALGTWTECDDHGVFEWKPLTLKMKVFPADNVDVDVLLAELATANIVHAFEYEGKKYGAVRNFCKYQRPKKPAYRHPLRDELRTYVNSKDVSSEPVPHQEPTAPEKSPQMEDEGGKREKKEDIRAVGKPTRSAIEEAFEDFWKVYPKRGGANPKSPALKVFRTFVAAGIEPQAIIAGARRCAEKERGKVGTEFIPQATKWLRDRRWEDYNADAADALKCEARSSETGFYATDRSPELDAWDAYFVATKGVNAPRDRNFGWRFPAQWPPSFKPQESKQHEVAT